MTVVLTEKPSNVAAFRLVPADESQHRDAAFQVQPDLVIRGERHRQIMFDFGYCIAGLLQQELETSAQSRKALGAMW
jgi:hypothetical protein